MLKKQTQRDLTLYFSAMIFIHGFILWHWRHDIAIGYPDFSSFYTAAKILQHDRGHQLYDLGLQEEVQLAVIPEGYQQRRALLPYNHPPFEAVLFLPLARFSYLTAYLIWLSINIGLLMAAISLLRKCVLFVGRAPFYLWTLACFGFTPIFIALVHGQDSIFLLFCFCMVFLSLYYGSEFRAGLWLGLALFKFQIVLPFLIPFLLLKRRLMVAGFCLVGILLSLFGLGVVGWGGLLNYPSYVWALDHNKKFGSLVSSETTPDLHGLISSLIPQQYSGLGGGFLLVCSLILLATVTATGRNGNRPDPTYSQRWFALNLIASVLLSYHIWVHDLSLLFLALLLILQCTGFGSLLPVWSRTSTLVCVTLLYSPLTLVLMHFRRLDLLTIVLLVLLGTLLIQRSRTDVPAT